MWMLDFGRVDAGSSQTNTFYLKNLSEGVIEDMEIKVSPPAKAGVKVEMMSKEYIQGLVPGAVHTVQLKWIAADDVKAGECKGTITIRGMLTIETLHYPS